MKLRHELEGDGAKDLKKEAYNKILSKGAKYVIHLRLVVLCGHQVSLLGSLSEQEVLDVNVGI